MPHYHVLKYGKHGPNRSFISHRHCKKTVIIKAKIQQGMTILSSITLHHSLTHHI